MKKIFTISLIFCLTVLFFNTEIKAQTTTYDLKFSRAIIVDANEVTVPANTVWKVTSIYGEENGTCIPVPCFSATLYYGKGIATRMYINNVHIPSTISGFKISSTLYSDVNCSVSVSGAYDLTCANKTADPNILPLWLPAGTTLKSGGPNTFVSVIEFVLQ
jgi:hypothetical protein